MTSKQFELAIKNLLKLNPKANKEYYKNLIKKFKKKYEQ